MKPFIIGCLCLLSFSSFALAQWKVVKVEAAGPENRPGALPDDLWLTIDLKNDSGQTLYVPGLWGRWYMIESYIKDDEGSVWQRQNVGVDQELVMTPVAAGATINAGGRYSRKHVGCQMLLTFMMARSEHDKTGSRILVGPFTIPAPPDAEKKQ